MPKNTNINVHDWGLIDYHSSFQKQEILFKETLYIKSENRQKPEDRQLITENHLVFCEHSPVYTLGRSGLEEHLLLQESELINHGAIFASTNRGGDITFHGPGQLIMYPIIDLENFFTDIHRYMRVMEETVIQTLSHFGLNAGRIAGLTGVWLRHENTTTAAKICAMGVKTSRWVTMHGLALNVNTNLAFFDHIVPCGIKEKSVTSMQQELGREIDMEQVKNLMKNNFIQLINSPHS